MRELKHHSLKLDVNEDGAYILSALPATELGSLDSISKQTERLTRWAEQAFAHLLTLKPGRAS
jgi:hypothetical protein